MPDSPISLVLQVAGPRAQTEACIASLRSAATRVPELVVLHDPSVEDVTRLQNDADRVVAMRSGETVGAALNRGLSAATRRHVLFADDTIRFSPGCLDTVAEEMGAEHVVVVRLPLGRVTGVESFAGYTYSLSPFSLPLTPGALIVESEILDRLGGWDESYRSMEVAELHLLFQLWANGFRVVCAPQAAPSGQGPVVGAARMRRDAVSWRDLGSFVERWTATEMAASFLGTCSEREFAENLSRAGDAAALLGRIADEGAPPSELARRYLEARQAAFLLESRNTQLIEQRRALRREVAEFSRPSGRDLPRVISRAVRLTRRAAARVRRLVPTRRTAVDHPEPLPSQPAARAGAGRTEHPLKAHYQGALARSTFSGNARRSVAFAVSTTDLDAGRGDVFVAVGIGRELEKLGCEVVYVEPAGWYRLPVGCDLVVAMLPDFDPSRLPDRVPAVAWVRNETERWVRQAHLGFFDMVLCSSGASEHAIRSRYPGPTARLAIGVDTGLFEDGSAPHRTGVSTTVNQWGMEREVYSGLRSAPIDFPLDIYGQGKGFPPELLAQWRGPVSYFELPAIYARSLVVLDDFNHTTAAYGNVNSRVFEALAAGALPVTNRRAGLHELGLGEIPTYSGRHGLLPLVRQLLEEPGTSPLASRLSAHVRREHSYERRAAAFDALTRDLDCTKRTTVVAVRPRFGPIEEWYSDLAAAGAWLLPSSPGEFPIDVARSERFGSSILHLIGTEGLRAQPVEMAAALRECLERGTPFVFSATEPGDGTVHLPGLTPPLAAEAAVYHPMSDDPQPEMTLPMPDSWLALRRAQRHALGVDPDAPTCVLLDPTDVTPYQAAFVEARRSSPNLRLVVAGEIGPDAWHPGEGVICRLHPLDDRDRFGLIAAADVILMASDARDLLARVQAARALACPVGLVQEGPRVAALDDCTWLQPVELEGFMRDAKPLGQLPYTSLSDSVLSAVSRP